MVIFSRTRDTSKKTFLANPAAPQSTGGGSSSLNTMTSNGQRRRYQTAKPQWCLTTRRGQSIPPVYRHQLTVAVQELGEALG
jgi:hypothetical protein